MRKKTLVGVAQLRSVETHGPVQKNSRGFSLIELLVVMAVIVILVSITSWGISLANTSAKTNHCANNLRQIGIAFHRFQHAFGKTPDANTVLNGLGEYLETQSLIYICPAVPKAALGINVSYGVNPCVHRLLAESAKVVALDANADTLDYEGLDTALWETDTAPRHLDMMNVLFYDGHVDRHSVEELNPYAPTTGEQIRTARWKPDVGDCQCSNSYGNGYGLLGEYWADPNEWTGPPVQRIEPSIYFPFGAAGLYGVPYNIPLPGATADNPYPLKTAKYRGQIKADSSEPYTFHGCSDNRVWIFVNGTQVLETQMDGAGGVMTWFASTTPVSLVSGRWVDFEVRYLEHGSGSPSHLMVQWSCPSSPTRATIPTSNMRPARK